MANSYKLPLAVCDTNGKIIVATVTPLGKDRVNLRLPKIEEVLKNKGSLAYEYNSIDHAEIVQRLTTYLESLFLKELENESSNTGKHSGDKSTGTKVSAIPDSVGSSEGKEPGGIHSGGRGRKSPHSNKRRIPEDDLAEVSDTESK